MGISQAGWKAAVTIGMVVIATAFGASKPSTNKPQDSSVADLSLQPMEPQTVTPPAPVFRPRPVLQSPASFTYDMPLEEAIDILRHSTRPPLKIVVLWSDLENNAGIDRTTPIGIDGLSGIRLRQCFDLLVTSLSATADTKIGYIVRDGVITIGTVEYLPQAPRVTHVYDISDLAAPPSQAMGMGMGMGMMPGMGMMGMGTMGMGMMSGMMSGLGSLGYGGLSGSNSGYGTYGSPSGYNNSPRGLPGFINGTQTGVGR